MLHDDSKDRVIFLSIVAEYHLITPVFSEKIWLEGSMAGDLQIQQDITRDLLDRMVSPSQDVREGAVEALAVSAEDEAWRPDELIEQGGIDIVGALLQENNTHIVVSALDIIIATAAAGKEEELITGGVIDRLDQIQDHKDTLIRNKVHEALGLLVPEVEDVVTSKPHDDY
jgi:hypothetical protein